MSKHLVYGNGESRPRELLSGNFITWGCNAIYRDLVVDNLVAIDYSIQQEIYESGYAMKNKCWFANWEVLPAEFAPDAIIAGWDDAVYETAKKGRNSCVVQGKTKETAEDQLNSMLEHNGALDIEDYKTKTEKDIGLYITWVDEYNDKVIDIEYPTSEHRNWSAGNTALHLACRFGATEIYMLGFDGSNYNKPINNVYKGSDHYLPEKSRGFNSTNWDKQFRRVQRDFPNVQFYNVGTDLKPPKSVCHPSVMAKSLINLTYEELKQKHTST